MRCLGTLKHFARWEWSEDDRVASQPRTTVVWSRRAHGTYLQYTGGHEPATDSLEGTHDRDVRISTTHLLLSASHGYASRHLLLFKA